MLSILLKNRIRMLLSFSKDKSKTRWFVVFVSMFFLFGWIFRSVWLKLNQFAISDPDTGVKIIKWFVAISFHGTFLMLCFYGLSFAIFAVFFGKDLELLFSCPIKSSTIYLYKYIDAALMNMRFSLLFLVPSLFLLGLFYNGGIVFYIFSLIILIMLTSIPGSIGIILASIVSKKISKGRLKNILAGLGALLGILIWISINKVTIGFENITPGSTDFSILENSFVISPVIKYLPSGWGALAVINFAQGNWEVGLYYFVILASGSVLLGVISFKLISGYYQSGIVEESSTVGETIFQDSGPSGSAIMAHLKRDIILLYREYNVLMSSMVFAAILAIFPLIEVDRASLKPFYSYLSFPMMGFAIALGNQMGSRLIPLEKLGFWWNLITPNGLRLLLISKTVIGLIFVTILCVLAGLIHRILGITEDYNGLLILIGTAWGGFAIGMPVGAYFANFNWDNPNRMLTTGGLIMFIFLLIIISLVTIGIYLLINWILKGTLHPGIYAMTLASIFVFISLIVTGRKLSNFEWKPDV